MASAKNTLFATAAPMIGGLLTTISSDIGLKPGETDARAFQMRCGQSALFA